MAPPPQFYEPTLALPQPATATETQPTSITFDAQYYGAPPPTQGFTSHTFESTFTATFTNTFYLEPTLLPNPNDPLGLDNSGPGLEWYSEPFVVLMAWGLIIYSLMSLFMMVMMLSRGWLDWKLNLSPDAFSREDLSQDLPELFNDPGIGSRHFRHREYEPRESLSDNDNEEDDGFCRVEWWEAIEMQPYRRTAHRLRASHVLYGDGADRVAARIPMPHPGDPSDWPTRRSALAGRG